MLNYSNELRKLSEGSGSRSIKARKLECIIQEIGLKVLYYNYLRSDTRAYG
jgi:hypothetical protein